MKTISLVVPCYNEEDNIKPFLIEVEANFAKLTEYDYEIVFVNDGSKDTTKKVILDFAKDNKRIKLVDLARNFGKEIALSAGLDYATGDAVIPMDVDMQDPPELILEFVKKWEEGYDVVYGVRSTRNGDPYLKKLTAFWFYRVINFLSETPIPVDTGDFRLMDRKVVDSLKLIKEKHRFMKGIFAWVGFNQIGVNYERKERTIGKSKFNFTKLLALAFEGITSFSVRPLRIASIIGFLVSLGAFFYGTFITLRSIFFGTDVHGYPSLVVMILFLGGVQLITIGILGEYIGKIYTEIKARPLYLVNETIGF